MAFIQLMLFVLLLIILHELGHTVGLGHSYSKHQVITISGANEAEHNGEFRITEIPSANIFKYETVATADATGAAIAASVSPLGWTKVYEDVPASQVVYKPTNASTGDHYYKITDAATTGAVNTNTHLESGKWALLQLYSAMTDINTGTLEVTRRLPKNHNSGDWDIIGSDKRFIFLQFF